MLTPSISRVDEHARAREGITPRELSHGTTRSLLYPGSFSFTSCRETSDPGKFWLEVQNIGVGFFSVEWRMPSFQKHNHSRPQSSCLLHVNSTHARKSFRVVENQTWSTNELFCCFTSVLQRNVWESLVSSSLRSKERRLEVRDWLANITLGSKLSVSFLWLAFNCS